MEEDKAIVMLRGEGYEIARYFSATSEAQLLVDCDTRTTSSNEQIGVTKAKLSSVCCMRGNAFASLRFVRKRSFVSM